MKKDNLFSIPNAISLLRLFLLIPIFWLLSQGWKFYALAVILLCGLSDYLDGFIARKWHLQSDAGRIIDPVVDKISLVGLMIFLVISSEYMFPKWFFIFIVVRESMVLLFSLIFIEHKKMVMESSTPGKVSAFATGITIILYILQLHPYTWIMVWLATVLTLYSSWIYFKRFKKYYDNKKNSNGLFDSNNQEMKV